MASTQDGTGSAQAKAGAAPATAGTATTSTTHTALIMPAASIRRVKSSARSGARCLTPTGTVRTTDAVEDRRDRATAATASRATVESWISFRQLLGRGAHVVQT